MSFLYHGFSEGSIVFHVTQLDLRFIYFILLISIRTVTVPLSPFLILIVLSSSIDAECTESHLGDLLASIDYSSKCLRIAHINICSLRNKLDELRVLQELCKFDMIGITESHLNTKDRNSELNIDGLKFIRRDRTGRKGGGCVLYYREDLRVIHRRDLNHSDIEAIWIEVKFPSRSFIVHRTNKISSKTSAPFLKRLGLNRTIFFYWAISTAI